ncbi:MAG: restriction endonuclease subunit S [Flavobacteriales bacterium]|nr:restriction endonuclease subunit S [Flavobacteriales bacterium]
MTEEHEYDLPEGWRHGRIGGVVLKAKQRDPRKAPEAMFQYVDVSGVSNESFRITEATPLKGKDAPSRARKEILEDDVLFATVRPTLKRVALVPKELHGQIASTGYSVLRSDKSKVEPRYLYAHLLTDGFIARMGSLERGAGYPAVRESDVLGSPLPLPPLPEQQRIAQVLSTVQEAIAQQERLIRTTTELKQALMQKLFTEGLRGEALKETEIGRVPESWEVVALRDVCDFQSGGTPSKQRPEYWDGAIPWVSPKDMKRPRLTDVVDHISEEGLEAGSRLAPAGSVLIVIRGMILAKDVPVAIAEVPMAINQDMKAIIPGDRIVADFLLYALVAYKEKLFHKVGRSAHGTMTLMSEEIFSFQVPLPPLEVQSQIADVFKNMDLKLELHARRRDELKDLFRTLLHELMPGKVRVGEHQFT